MAAQTLTSPPALLALETSTERCSVALLVHGELTERSVAADSGHSENVLPLVRELLGRAGLRLGDLDAIAYGSGPGAFTGLRLACAVSQGLAFGAGLPVIGVGTLEALAWASGRHQVYVALDARMNELYCAAYRVSGQELEEVLPPAVLAPAQALLPPGEGWFGCGSGFRVHDGALARRLGAALAAVDMAAMPDAGSVARLAAARFERAGDPYAAQPAYVRQKVALTTAERLALGGRT